MIKSIKNVRIIFCQFRESREDKKGNVSLKVGRIRKCFSSLMQNDQMKKK